MTGPVKPTPRGEEVVTALKTSMAALVAESQALRSDVHRAEQARKRANQINAVVLGVVALFVAALAVIGYQVSVTNQRMVDCTTPGGRCYQQGQQRTAAAVGDVLRVSIYMAECSRLLPGESGPDFDRKLERCVFEKLAADDKTNPVPQVSPTPSAR